MFIPLTQTGKKKKQKKKPWGVQQGLAVPCAGRNKTVVHSSRAHVD